MCFILCCCCNWCNPYSSKCVEITILILSFSTFASSMIGLICVKNEHSSKEGFICLIVVIIFSVILIISIILILSWRLKSTINNTRNFAGSAFSKIGLVSSIFCILFTGIWESLTISKFYDLNNPCRNIERTDIILNDNKTNLLNLLLRRNRRNLITYEENKEEFCIENPNYNIDVVSIMEYLYLLISASILELILLVLLYFWYNDFRRIKYLVDGPLIDSNTKETKIKYDDKKSNFNNHFNLMLYGQNDYVAHYDIFGRPIFNMKKRKTKVVNININNNNKYLKYNINYSREDSKNKDNITNYNDDDKNKNSVDIEKIVYFEKKNNAHNNSERVNIYNIKNRKLNIYNNNNLNISKNSSKTRIIENSIYNNDK